MLKVYAEKYVEIGLTIQRIRARMPLDDGTPYPINSRIGEVEREYMHSALSDIKNHCDQLNLMVSSDFLKHHLSIFGWGILDDWEPLESMISNFELVLNSELSRCTFFFILPHRLPYYSDGDTFGEEMSGLISNSATFPDAKHDITEAGNCFAFERFTACVYHLMRAAEFGLLGVAASIGVPEENCTSWGKMIGGINGKVKLAVSAKEPNFKDTEKKYGDLCSWFENIKNGWRNPVSHVPRIYSENTAKGMISALRTLFEHLTQYGIGQAKMPPEPIALPGSEGE
jgi:hypothetical protein